MNRIASFLLVLLGPIAVSVADPIHDAARTGDTEQGRKLVDGGAGIESKGAQDPDSARTMIKLSSGDKICALEADK